jgi:hypothetical protein
MVYTLDSGSSGGNPVEVRALSRAPSYHPVSSSHNTVPDTIVSGTVLVFTALHKSKIGSDTYLTSRTYQRNLR